MPHFDRTEGIILDSGDACKTCRNYPDRCNVMSDFRLEGREAKWEGTRIVQVGEAKGREGYLECQMYENWVPRGDLKDHPDIKRQEFGVADSQEAFEYYNYTQPKKNS